MDALELDLAQSTSFESRNSIFLYNVVAQSVTAKSIYS